MHNSNLSTASNQVPEPGAPHVSPYYYDTDPHHGYQPYQPYPYDEHHYAYYPATHFPHEPPALFPESPADAVSPCDVHQSSCASDGTEGAEDGVVPPETLTLPFAVLQGYATQQGEEDDGKKDKEAVADKAVRKRLKKKAKKQKKKLKRKELEKPDPRLDVNYWLHAPRATDCCITPVDDDPVPYELLASM